MRFVLDYDQDNRGPTVYIRDCPHCKKQIGFRLRWKLPKGYDDPNHPVSMYPPGQVGNLDVELFPE